MTITKNKKKIILIDMSATLIHHGHIRLLKKASELGDVIVALTTDEEIKKHKGYTPELNFTNRKETQAGADTVFEKIKFGKIKIRISKKYALADAKQAHADLEARKLMGPAILIP